MEDISHKKKSKFIDQQTDSDIQADTLTDKQIQRQQTNRQNINIESKMQ